MNKELLDKRWRKADLAAWYLQIIPFIRFVGISGSMTFGNIKDSSDIDMFIIAKDKRIWTCFYFSRLSLFCLGQLRSNKNRAGKICPNRYVTDEYLIINPQNKYLAQQYNNLVPIFDDENYFQKFLTANKWIKDFGFTRPVTAINLVQSNLLNSIRTITEFILSGFFGDWLESVIKKVQIKKIAKEEPTLNQPDSSVVVSDNEIRIHPYNSK